MPQLNARYQQKIDTTAKWNNAVNFIPMLGEIIIYKADSTYTYDRIKIGDGIHKVTELPFAENNEPLYF